MKNKKFTVNVCRVSYAFHSIVVEAKTEKEAEKLALDQAGDHEYSEKSADYTVDCCLELPKTS